MRYDAFKAQERASYDRVAEDYDTFIDRLAGPLAERLCELARIAPGAHVLDVGCGTGVATRRAAARTGATGRVLGIDISPGMIEAARRNTNSHVDLAVMDAEALEFEPGSFDAVVSLCAVLHFPSLERAIAEMHRVLKPGGTLAVAFGRPRPESGMALARHGLRRTFTVRNKLVAPRALREVAHQVLPASPEPEGVLAEWGRRRARPKLQKELRRAGFEDLAWSWLGHEVRFDSPLEFTEAQLAIDTQVRKHADAVGEGARDALRAALLEHSQHAVAGGLTLVYPYSATFLAARRPVSR
jgi:ubiquinone/menaquinone biosynthesis C-methylase UbiE